MLFEFRVRHSEFTFLYHPSGVRRASLTFNIAYSANHSSCRSCLRRYCTSTSLQSSSQSLSQGEISCHSVSALSSIRKLPPGSVIPQRIVAEPSHILFDDFDPAVRFSSMFRRRLSFSNSSIENRHFVSVSGIRRRRTSSVNCTKSCSDELLSTSVQGGLPVSMT